MFSGSVLEHLQSIGFFTERVFNLYYIYVRVFLPYLFCKKNAPKLVSTQYNEVSLLFFALHFGWRTSANAEGNGHMFAGPLGPYSTNA